MATTQMGVENRPTRNGRFLKVYIGIRKEDIPKKRNNVRKGKHYLLFHIVTAGLHEEAPLARFQLPKKEHNYDCCICLETVDQGAILITPCDHHFCYRCLKTWFDTQRQRRQESTCPTCRRNQPELGDFLHGDNCTEFCI